MDLLMTIFLIQIAKKVKTLWFVIYMDREIPKV